MIVKDKPYVVMGLLDSASIAYAIGKGIEAHGGSVIYTVQNERMKRIFLDRSKTLSQEEKDGLNVRYCDITIESEVEELFKEIGPIAGVVHSIAFSNPKTSLGEEFHTDAVEDLKLGFHISAASLATVVRYAQPQLVDGGGIVALTFSSHLAWPCYNWMGVNKAALEAVVRALARRHGKDNLRINAISAGPLLTKAAGSIPGFGDLGDTWRKISPLKWDPTAETPAVADAALFLLGPYARMITGQTIHVDGGACIVGGEIQPYEQ